MTALSKAGGNCAEKLCNKQNYVYGDGIRKIPRTHVCKSVKNENAEKSAESYWLIGT